MRGLTSKPSLLLLVPARTRVLIKTHIRGAFLVAQQLRICLPMQGTRVRALVQEDPTCCGATKPVHHNYWACALEPVTHNYWAHMPQLLSPHATTTEPTCHNYWARIPQLLKPCDYSPCSATREATAMRSPCTTMKSSPRSPPSRESQCAAMKTQQSQK